MRAEADVADVVAIWRRKYGCGNPEAEEEGVAG